MACSDLKLALKIDWLRSRRALGHHDLAVSVEEVQCNLCGWLASVQPTLISTATARGPGNGAVTDQPAPIRCTFPLGAS